MEADGQCLYEVLGVASDASQADIKKAYRTLALRCHPDKCPGDETAKASFQSLQRIYAVLGDPEKCGPTQATQLPPAALCQGRQAPIEIPSQLPKRKVYDQTGSLADSEELAGEQFDALREYFRALYKQVTVEDIEELEGSFRGSPEEAAELLDLHERFAGDMPRVFGWLMFSDPRRDAHRFADALRAAVADGRARDHCKFRAWAAKVDARPRPKGDPLASRKRGRKDKEKGGRAAADEQALIAQIRGRAAGAQGAGGLLASLEARYCGKAAARAGKKGAPPDEPPEEAFAAMRASAGAPAAGAPAKGARPTRKRAKA